MNISAREKLLVIVALAVVGIYGADAYVMPAERSLDIDYPWQFDLAEHWAKQVQSTDS